MSFGKVNYGTNSGLKSDTGDFEKQSMKPLKYYTTNWNSETLKSDAGINFTEGFGKPAGFTNTESQLIRSTITNPRIRQNFGFLPFATTGGLPMNGPTISEENSRDKKSCKEPKNYLFDKKFFNLDKHQNVVETNRKGQDTRQIGRKSSNDKN